ncbi:MAG: AI-2E family transporter [Elusimicrobiota bacterium]|jgi:predicted PurR-regulated permease PerM|nr:AI-2E family transporter [Elusimicrobiota bacterium]
MKERSQNKWFFICLLLCIACAVFVFLARKIVLPFVLAAFLSYLLSPVVNLIRCFGVRKWAAVSAVFLVFALIVTILLIVFIPKIVNEFNVLLRNAPWYYEYIQNEFMFIVNRLEQTFPMFEKLHLFDLVQTKLTQSIANGFQSAFVFIKNFVSAFSLILIVPMLTFFLLMANERWSDIIIDIMPSDFSEVLLSIFYEVTSTLGNYIRGQICESLFIATAISIAMSVLGINFALFIGLGAGIANLIPYLGSITGATIACIIALVQYQDFSIIFKIIPCFVIIQFIDNHAVQPLVIGPFVNLSPPAIIFALLAGAQVFGIIGMIFAVPTMAIIKSIFFLLVEKYKEARIS